MIVSLDYADLKIHATSDIEQRVRAFSAAKEPETVKWIESLPVGSKLWDVGANIGAYSLIAASRGLEVDAFEPVMASYERLVENIALNGLDVDPYPVALTDHSGVAMMNLSSEEPGSASHSFGKGDTQVRCIRGDDMSALHPDHMKIDVDGAEVPVLRGCEKILTFVESVLIEVDNWSSVMVTAMLKNAGLRQDSRHYHERSGVTNVIYRRS